MRFPGVRNMAVVRGEFIDMSFILDLCSVFDRNVVTFWASNHCGGCYVWNDARASCRKYIGRPLKGTIKLIFIKLIFSSPTAGTVVNIPRWVWARSPFRAGAARYSPPKPQFRFLKRNLIVLGDKKAYVPPRRVPSCGNSSAGEKMGRQHCATGPRTCTILSARGRRAGWGDDPVRNRPVRCRHIAD